MAGAVSGTVWVWSELPAGASPTAEAAEAYAVGRWLSGRLGWAIETRKLASAGPAAPGSPAQPGPRATAAAMADHIRSAGHEEQPSIVLFPASDGAALVAACLAAELGTGLVSHCVELRLGPTTATFSATTDRLRGLEMLVPAPGGLAAITCPEARPVLVALGPGAAGRMGLKRPPAEADARSIELSLRALDTASRGPRFVSRGAEPAGTGTGAPASAAPGGPPNLASAKVVVAGGAGATLSAVWPDLETLASLLGAALGATRPAVDQGLAGEERMIGQSGARISPDVYLAFGISGDLQHTIGLEGAKMVIAVTRDPAAPIFGRADYGVVAELEAFVPALVERLRQG